MPQLLEGIAPPPTGTTRRWVVKDQDLYRLIYETLNEIRQFQAWGHDREAADLVEHLQTMDGFPKGEPGDHWEVSYEAPVRLVVPSSYVPSAPNRVFARHWLRGAPPARSPR